jgi:hypothetical protein
MTAECARLKPLQRSLDALHVTCVTVALAQEDCVTKWTQGPERDAMDTVIQAASRHREPFQTPQTSTKLITIKISIRNSSLFNYRLFPHTRKINLCSALALNIN